MKEYLSPTAQAVLACLSFLDVEHNNKGFFLKKRNGEILKRAFNLAELNRYLSEKYVKGYNPEAEGLQDAAFFEGRIYFEHNSFDTYFIDNLGFYHAGQNGACRISLNGGKTFHSLFSIQGKDIIEHWDAIVEAMDKNVLELAKETCDNPNAMYPLFDMYLSLAPHDLVIDTTDPAIRDIIENDDHMYFGLRTQEVPFTLGPIDHTSKLWIDGEETETDLDGLSVTSMEAPDTLNYQSYYGEHQALIGFNHCHAGEDPYELIAQDPVVLYIIR